MKNTQIHSTAIVNKKAEVGSGVIISPYSIIHGNVKIGDNSQIGSFCEIGLPTPHANVHKLEIGEESLIRSHSVIYLGSKIGAGLVTGHHTNIRENSVIGSGFQLGNRSDVQGDCLIGDFVRTHADVHIGKKSKLGSFIWLFPNVLLANDPVPPSESLSGVTIDDYAIVAANTLLLPGIKIGKNAVIAAGSLVKFDVEEGMLVAGDPCSVVCQANVLRMPDDPTQRAYPWTSRFHRGYPEDVVEKWLSKI